MYAVAIKIHCFLKGVNALFGASGEIASNKSPLAKTKSDGIV